MITRATTALSDVIDYITFRMRATHIRQQAWTDTLSINTRFIWSAFWIMFTLNTETRYIWITLVTCLTGTSGSMIFYLTDRVLTTVTWLTTLTVYAGFVIITIFIWAADSMNLQFNCEKIMSIIYLFIKLIFGDNYCLISSILGI